MTAPADLLDCIEIETAPNPTHAVIWLHGLGADGNDFVPIVPELRLPAGAAVRFVFPNAPVQPVTINNGMAMRSWYDILVMDLVRVEDGQGIRRSEAEVRKLIARENARGIRTSRIVLAGFSQGCAMTLHTGLRLPEQLAGMIGLSGYLPLIDTAEAERHAANAGTPIFLAHGLYDPVVPLARAKATLAELQRLGCDVSWHTYPMPHSVCAEEVADISAFLGRVLG
ncbi:MULTISPECIES: alpha/beta hydrolase [unclassified Achromobacter]|uniref:alpha/beta hydrolase n=1 Tax=unclassified Achromobacter TaxID=2626865 RepID=UPI00069CC629|nr:MULTISPECIES: alpha/beta hydrolase [unclassified Achromobacter]KOF54152.1 carboxylesterase [Achromobacter sp. DMS1]